MNWGPLTLAVVFGAPAASMMVRHKAPRARAILAALALLCLLAGVPSFLAAMGHPLQPGVTMLVIIAVFIVSLFFVYLDIVRGEHKTVLFKGKGGGPGAPGGGGGGRNHHIRPLLSCVGLAMAGLLLIFNAGAVTQSVTGGFSQTVNTFAHHPGA